jgi:hypothetical protein
MTFHVDPAALRTAAAKIGDTRRVTDTAESYVRQHGSFTLHEQGLIGDLAPGHRHLMSDLSRLLSHLGQLGDASAAALKTTAERYEKTDHAAAAKLDASFPETP